MITVLADDITGAAEIAGVCLRYGLKVTFGIDTVPNVETDVCVIATDSRSRSELDAYRTHYQLAKTIFKDPDSIVFKKCDSVLRGYVLTELSALLDVRKFKKIVLQPANPASGRCIRDGIYYVGTEKIEHTDFARDPDFPASISEVKKLLLSRSAKYNQITEFHTAILSGLSENGLYVSDCTTVDDLIKGSKLSGTETLQCGSAAFFEQILLNIYSPIKTSVQPETISTGNFLLVSGSTHSASRTASDQFNGNRCPAASFPAALLQVKTEQGSLEAFAAELYRVWSQDKNLILTISEKKVDFPGSSTILKQRMGQLVKLLVEKCEIKELFIEGGATTYSILNCLNWKTLIPVEELSPGVVRMEILNTPSMHLTLKPGSYSWPEAITALLA